MSVQELIEECRKHKCFTARDIRVHRGLPMSLAVMIAAALKGEPNATPRPTEGGDRG